MPDFHLLATDPDNSRNSSWSASGEVIGPEMCLHHQVHGKEVACNLYCLVSALWILKWVKWSSEWDFVASPSTTILHYAGHVTPMFFTKTS